MSYQLIHTVTGSEPVTLTELKAWLKVDYSTADTLLTSLITAARREAESFCNRSFVAQTIEYSELMTAFPVKLPFPTHTEVTEVKVDGVVTTDYTKTGLTQYTVTVNISGTELYVKYKSSGDCPEQVKTFIKNWVGMEYDSNFNAGNIYKDLAHHKVY